MGRATSAFSAPPLGARIEPAATSTSLFPSSVTGRFWISSARNKELTKLLGRKVDVVVEGGLSPYLDPRILSEAVAL